MSSSNCCFLTCIQISQESGQVVWYSHLSQNFPQFIVIQIVKGFGIVNKAETDVFLKFSCFFDDPVDVGNLISGSSAFSKTSLNIWKFTIHVLLFSAFLPPLRPPCYLRHNNSEIRSVNNIAMASKYSHETKGCTPVTLSQKLKMIKSGEEAMLKVKKGQKLGLLNQIAKLRLQKKSSWRTFKVLLQ